MKGLKDLPVPEKIKKYRTNNILNVNAHIHTPYSFSAFEDLEEPFRMAVREGVEVLGINDFTSVKGYDESFRLGLENHIFPLLNIEFIGLLKNEQKQGVLVNDPNNPGRTYFSGKGLRYPFVPPAGRETLLEDLVTRGNKQVRQMVEKVNKHCEKNAPGIRLSFDKIKEDLSRGLVRERHVAKAIRLAVASVYPEADKQTEVFTRLFGGKAPSSHPDDPARLENEIRSRLLKKGGPGFIPEDPKAFLPVEEIRDYILAAGGIPCYPVLLDDPSGKITPFEYPKEKLAGTLKRMGIYAVEFIPGRNDCQVLEEYATYLYDGGFLVMFGTEHNTPEMIPLTVSCRHQVPLPEDLRRISYQSACVVAAHQYLISQGKEGYSREDGSCRVNERDELITLGDGVIKYFQKIK